MNKHLLSWLILFFALLAACTANTQPTPRPRNDNDDGDASTRQSADDFSNDDFVESWEFLPFYGELRFKLLDADTKISISAGLLEVDNLSVDPADKLAADENGRITFHQLERGIMYVGNGPPPPQFTFSAPGYTSRQLNTEELAAVSGYEPYNSEGVPLTEWIDSAGTVQELPLYEFIITLTCAQTPCPSE